MNRGTTPTHTFTIPFDTSLIKEVKIIYSQDDEQVLCKRTEDCELNGNEIKTTLSQEETFMFDCKKLVQIQIRVLTLVGESLITPIIARTVEKCLDDEVLV